MTRFRRVVHRGGIREFGGVCCRPVRYMRVVNQVLLVLVYRGGCGDITGDRVGGDPQAGGGGCHRVTAPHGGTV